MTRPTTLIPRRRFLAGAALGALALPAVLEACGSSGTGGKETGPVTLSFWKSPHNAQEEAQLWQPILSDFTKQHSSIHVNHTVVPWTNLDEKFTAAFVSGQPPDVMYLPDESFPKYASQGKLMDLGSEVSSLKSQYDPRFWSAGAYRGKQYGVPFLAVVQALLINVTMFEQAGLQVPRTWSDVQSAAKRLTDPSKGVYGYSGNSENCFVALLAAGGTTVLDKKLSKVTANTQGGVAAWTEGLQNPGARDNSMVPVSFTEDQVSDLSLKGRIGMMWAEQSVIKPQFRKLAPDIKLEVIPLPKADASHGRPSVWTNVGFMFVAKDTKHPDAAMELLKYLSRKQVQQTYVLDGVDLISPMKGLVASDQDPVVKKYLSFLDAAVGPPVSVHWRDSKQLLVQEGQGVISGQHPAKQALGDFATQVGPTLDGR